LFNETQEFFMLLRHVVVGLALFTVAGLSSADPITLSVYPDSDQEITRQVERLIDEHPDLGTLLTVRTKNGIVYLDGTVATPFALANADCLVGHMPRVQRVVDIAGVAE
jgi:osmotically-inducible protein OsmY